MKFLQIPSFLLSKDLTRHLRLNEQSYLLIIPKTILQKYGFESENLDFSLSVINNKITLVGPAVEQSRRVKQSHNSKETTV